MSTTNNALVQKIIDYIGYSDAAMTKAAADPAASERCSWLPLSRPP
jgi:hypothetical protein